MADEDTPLAGSAEGESPQPASEAVTETTDQKPPAEGDQKAPETPEGAEAGEGATTDAPVETEAEKRQKTSAAERIKTLTRHRREAERKAQAAIEREQRLLERLKLYEGPTPDRFEFETDEAYQAALVAHQVKQQTKAERESDIADVRVEQERHTLTAVEARQEAFNARAAEFAQRVPDYQDTVADQTLPITPEMSAQIQSAEHGPDIAYYLGKNRAEAARIAVLTSPTDVAREIGRIEGRLMRPTPKKISDAPNPVGAVATGSGSAAAYDPSKATYDQTRARLQKAGLVR